MKWILILFMCLTLSSCSAGALLTKIPDHEFELFEYHRTGNVTSTHIIAENSIRKNNTLKVDHVQITSDYGPFASFNITIKGYKRR